jgi:hypothetical protein
MTQLPLGLIDSPECRLPLTRISRTLADEIDELLDISGVVSSRDTFLKAVATG